MWALSSSNGLTMQQEMCDLSKLIKIEWGIISLDYKNDLLLIGTKGGEIIETKGGANPTIV